MFYAKTKQLMVSVGVDSMGQVVITTESGHVIGLPYELFKVMFEPENDDSIEFFKALENRFTVRAPIFEFEQIKDDDGNIKGFRGKGSPL